MIERGGLEIRCTVYPYRGFESLTFRCFIQWDAIIRIPFCTFALENSFTTKRLLARNVSPLMPINCLINCPINQRVKETKRGRDKETKRLREGEAKRQSDKKKKGQRQITMFATRNRSLWLNQTQVNVSTGAVCPLGDAFPRVFFIELGCRFI